MGDVKALMVWLREPPMTLLIEADRLKPQDWKRRSVFGLKRHIDAVEVGGRCVLFWVDNVLMVKEVTEKDIQEAKDRRARAEAEAQTQGKAQGRISRPAMVIPGIRGGH